MAEINQVEIAARLRSILGVLDAADLEHLDAHASRLGVSEAVVRQSLDVESPHPSIDVLAAVVHLYGVDPTWLTTGNYSSATHNQLIDGSARSARDLLTEVIHRNTPPGTSPVFEERHHA